MKYCLWLALPILVLASLLACNSIGTKTSLAPEEDDAPLLLDELDPDEEDRPEPKGPVANNSRCYVCHLNFDGEHFTTIHMRQNVGCERCHGASDAHCSDEDNITPPDIMFAKDKIIGFCYGCHEEKELRKPKGHKEFYAGTSKEKVCSECHCDKHRPAVRTRRWDKKTRKLIFDDKVRMMD